MPSTLEEEPKSATRPLGSKNVLDSRNEEEESSSSEIQDMKQLEGMLSVRTLRMVMFTFCLYSCLSSDVYFGFGFGVLRNSYEKQKWETHMNEKNKHRTVLSKVHIFFKQQSHQIFACLFVFLCTTLNLWIIDQWCM